MTYSVSVPAAVRRYVLRLEPARQRLIAARLRLPSDNPYDHSHSKSLHGDLAGFRSSDIGGFRIIYSADEVIRILDVIDIGPRGDIYKR